jgi:superfamily I DNA and/or RNA helicase
LLIPLQFGSSKLVMVGDPEQLRSTVLSKVCPVYSKNIAKNDDLVLFLLRWLDTVFKHSGV